MAGPWEKYSSLAEPVAMKPWERFTQPQETKESIGRTAFDQGMQGATSGFADELSDGLAAMVVPYVPKFLGGDPELFENSKLSDRLSQAAELSNDRLSRQWDQNPATTIAANLAGGLTTGIAGAAKAGATKAGATVGNLIRDSNLPTRIAAGAAGGAASGGLYGLGSAEDGQRLDRAQDGAVLGAVGGAIIPAAGAGLSRLNTRTIVPTSDEIRAAGSELFKKADELGGVLKPEIADKFYSKISQIRPQTAAGQVFRGKSAVDDIIEALPTLKGQPLSLQGAKEVDEALGDLAYSNVDKFGKITADGKKYLDMQIALRETIEGADESMVSGGKAGFEAIKEARNAWSTSLKMRDIERIIQNADLTDNPASSIRSGFRTLLRNGNKLKGYSPEEMAAIQKAAETGIVTDMFRLAGSGLVPIGAGIGGTIATGGLGGAAAATAGFAVQQGAKHVASSRQAARASDALRKVANRSGMVRTEKRIDPAKFAEIMKMPPRQAQQVMREMDAEVSGVEPQRLLTAPTALKSLPAPEKDFVADRAGNVRQASSQEQNRNITKRQRSETLGLSRDIYKVMDDYRARMGTEKTKELMGKYGMTKLGKFVAQNPDLRMLDLDEATLYRMLDDIE